MTERDHLAASDPISVIQITFLPGDLHELAKMMLSGLEKIACPTVQLKYVGDKFMLAQLSGLIELRVTFRTAQAGSIDQAL